MTMMMMLTILDITVQAPSVILLLLKARAKVLPAEHRTEPRRARPACWKLHINPVSLHWTVSSSPSGAHQGPGQNLCKSDAQTLVLRERESPCLPT